jgi:hypothetical protein|tara:strand:- start:864 stop:1091 length:228 start_codon:yes stop_codon:yes gene_type:complete
MTELQGTHPRKPDWVHYLCNGCDAIFWAPWKKNKSHYCADCAKTDDSVHFTGGRGSPQEAHDRDYHGGQFARGEW